MRGPKKSLATLWFVALLGVVAVAPAQTRQEVREDRKEKREERKELRDDKKELRDDKKELRDDKKELREDKKEGADAKELAADRKELRDDKKEIADDKRDIRKARHELREDRRDKRKARLKEIKDKWGDLTKRPEARNELEMHGRRMARLERAKAVATAESKKELAARIDKLIGKEQARHQRAMERLKEKAPGGAP